MSLPPEHESEQAEVADPETHIYQGRIAPETTIPATSSQPPPREALATGAPLAQVVVQKREGLTRSITQPYPGQEKPSLEGTIQPNPEVSSADVIPLGQVPTLPQLATPGQDEAAGGQVQQVEPRIGRTKPSLGFQENSPVAPQVSSSQESLSGPRPEENKGAPEETSRSSEVAGTVPKEENEPAKAAISLPPEPRSEQAQAAALETNLHQEGSASETSTTPNAAPESPPREARVTGAPLAQVVVQKGENLTKIIAQHYPGQEDLGLQATILANPEISSENIIHLGQVLTLPQIDVSEHVIHLHDGRLYAPYGNYYSAASWEKDKPGLEENQVRFLVRVCQEVTGRVIHRVFLGGYETATDLKQARDRLTQKDRAQVGINSENPGGPASTARQEDIPSGSPPAEAASNSDSLAPAVENQPGPDPPAPAGGPAGKGETRLKAEKMTAVKYFPKRWLEGRFFPMPLLQSRTFQQAAAYVDLIICRYRTIFKSWLLPIPRPKSQQATSSAILAVENIMGDSKGVWQSVILAGKEENEQSEPLPERGFPRSPSLRGYLTKLSIYPLSLTEVLWKPLIRGKISHVTTDALPNTSDIQGKDAQAGPQDLKTKGRPKEQEPSRFPPEPGPPEKALPPDVIRRYWDAQSVLHLVNGELEKPKPGIEAIPAEGLKENQPEEKEEPQDLLPVREVSWPGQGQNPLSLPGGDTLEKTLPPPGEGAIRRYRDTGGVLHIANAEPKDPVPTTTTASAEYQEKVNQGPKSLVKNVSFSGDQQLHPPALIPKSPKRTLPTLDEGDIRCYRSAKGILHIENVGSESAEAESAPKPSHPGRIKRELKDAGNDGLPSLPLEKVSLPIQSEPLRAPVKEIPPLRGELVTGGTIRRYRDARGVLHIETVENRKPETVPGPKLLAKPKNLPGLGGGPLSGPPPAKSRQGLRRLATSEVLAFRDRRGRFIIHNRERGNKIDGGHSEKAKAQLAPIIQEASLIYGLPVPLIQALIKVESNFVSRAVSPKGAMGLMQLMPGTAALLEVQDPFNPRENILGGCRYLRIMVDQFGGSLPLALAAYNAGPQRVVSCGFLVPAIEETQKFVTKVLARYYLLTKQGSRPL